jgi:diaminopropionate ammonia-lyase
LTASGFRFQANPRHGVPGIVVLPESGFRRAAAAIGSWAPPADPGQSAVDPRIGAAHAVTRLLAAELARRGGVLAAAPGDLLAGAYRAALDGVTIAVAGSVAFRSAAAETAGRCGAASRVVPAGEDHPLLLADTSWPGFAEPPRDVMQAQRWQLAQILSVDPPDLLVVADGVGGLAAAAAVQIRAQTLPTRLVVAQPAGRAWLVDALAAGALPELPPGEASLLAWQELERSAFAAVEVPPDSPAEHLALARAAARWLGSSAVPGLQTGGKTRAIG